MLTNKSFEILKAISLYDEINNEHKMRLFYEVLASDPNCINAILEIKKIQDKKK